MNEQAIRNALDDLETVAEYCEDQAASEFEAEMIADCVETIKDETGVDR